MSTRPPMALAVIGGGNIAHALLASPANNPAQQSLSVVVAEPDAARRSSLAPHVDKTVATAPEALEWLARSEPRPGVGQVLLAVKPQVLPALSREVQPWFAADAARRGPSDPRVVISLLAGTPTGRVRECLSSQVAVVRIMPNLPMRVGQAITAIALGAGATTEHAAFARSLFAGFGTVIEIDESQMDAFTAIAGSGPAYVFYLAEAMARAARELGFDEATADLIVRATIAGSGALLSQSSESPAQLRAAVTSKGGTTAAAIDVLDSARLNDTLVRAASAARDRGRELSRGQSPPT